MEVERKQEAIWVQLFHRKSYLEEIAAAKTLLDARNSAEEGLCLVEERNKLIKIADQLGWDTVKRYVSDPLAEDETWQVPA